MANKAPAASNATGPIVTDDITDLEQLAVRISWNNDPLTVFQVLVNDRPVVNDEVVDGRSQPPDQVGITVPPEEHAGDGARAVEYRVRAHARSSLRVRGRIGPANGTANNIAVVMAKKDAKDSVSLGGTKALSTGDPAFPFGKLVTFGSEG